MSRPDLRETIVIFRLGSLGDTIVALPCFNAIRKRHPKARLVVLTNFPVSSKAPPLLGVLGTDGQFVDEAVEYHSGLRSLPGFLALWKQLRAVGARRLIYLMPERSGFAVLRDWLFFQLCGFSRIEGLPTTRDLRQNRVAMDGTLEPEAERLARCGAAAFGPVDLRATESWDMRLTSAETARGHAAIASLGDTPRIAVNMGGKVMDNHWGIANWRDLIGRLSRQFPSMALVTIGAEVDAPQAEELLALWQGPGVNLCGKLSPRESAAALDGSVCFIGHDSGPLHLAAAMLVPVLGLFGSYNRPRKWHPIGPGARVIHRQEGIHAIRVDEVEAIAYAMITAQAGTP